MKKFLIVILSFLMIVFCVGCGAYSQNDTPFGDEDIGNVQQKPNIGDQQEEKFTVELKRNGSKYIPSYTPGKTLKARWTAIGGSSIHEAIFNDDGVAEIAGLDGDYQVTLVDLPDSVTYNPQGYTADNYDKHTVIEIIPISKTTHSTGSSLGASGNITIISEGTYRAIIDSAWNGAYDQYAKTFEGIVFYGFTPKRAGLYSIESFVDITANEVNPIMEYYIGNSIGGTQYWDSKYVDGGSYSTYTKNFRAEIVCEDASGSNSWYFGIHAESKQGTYPITIDFTIKYEDSLAGDGTTEPNYTVVEPKGPYGDPEANIVGTFRYNYRDTGKVLTGSYFKLNPADGFYHLYNENRYAVNNGFGPILYAKITKPTEVLDMPFANNSSSEGNGGLGTISLKLEYTDPFNCTKVIAKDYSKFIATYAKYCNLDGVHPVNEELKQFLQDYAVKETLFRDGNGWAELSTGLKSSFEDQWLFACGYYL